MALIVKEQDLRQLDIMLDHGTYRIVKVNRAYGGRDYYVLTAQRCCQDTIFVPHELRPDWGKKYLKGEDR